MKLNNPMMLAYKYFNDKENDEEVERRMEYESGKVVNKAKFLKQGVIQSIGLVTE